MRFGYDPRKDPGARIYQTLDFRLRHGRKYSFCISYPWLRHTVIPSTLISEVLLMLPIDGAVHMTSFSESRC